MTQTPVDPVTYTPPAPSFLLLFTCLKQMIPAVNYPRLRFSLPNNIRLDFYYFQEDNTVHLHYRERNHDNIYLGPINSEGLFTERVFPPNCEEHVFPLLLSLKTNFPRAIESYGQHTHLCALCSFPLIDPSSLARGTTPNCAPHLLPPADLTDI